MKWKKSKLISSEVKFCAFALWILLTNCQHKQDFGVDKDLQRRSIFVMGTKAEVFLDSNDQNLFPTLFTEFQKVEDYYSNYRQNSILMKLRMNREMSLPEDFNLLLKRSEEVCQWTGGVFNVKLAPLTEKLYRFNRKKSDQITKKASFIQFEKYNSSSPIASCKIDVRNDAELLDFGGIGKGFALDRARKKINQDSKFILKISGDIFCSRQCHFSIQIPPSIDKNKNILSALGGLKTCKPSSTISTSGNYNIFLGSPKNNHLLDLKKGHSQQNTHSITVVGQGSSATIDAITTTLSILSEADRLKFPLDKLAWIHINPEGKVQKSRNFSEYFCPQ